MADNNRIQEQLKEITEKLEQGIKEVFESEKYKEYLNTMSKFYNYSFNNTMLIAMQKPDATLVAGYNAWIAKFGRHVIKGEKGIQIIAPAPIKIKEEVEKLDPVTQEPQLDEKGQPIVEEVEITKPAYKVTSVFDVSQTEGRELPEITVKELDGDIKDYDVFMQALADIAPVPIGYEHIENGANGYYHMEDKRIAIREDMSELQTVKTAIHEIAHATLHDTEQKDIDMEPVKKTDRKTKEVEAESIAYTVCQHYGIDTSDYSFGYVAGWSSDKNMKELRNSLETIRKTSATLITTIDERVAELMAEKEQTKENTFGIYQLKKGEELHYHRFESLESLQKHGLTVERDNYELIYSAPLQEGQTLDDIFEEFNLSHPEGFTGHSLSVSDIVVLHKDGVNTAQYVDSFGFQEIPDFLEQKVELEQSQIAYEFADRYLMVHECDEGYDYTFYDKDYKEMDGGVYDNPDIKLHEAVHIILTDDPFPDMEKTVIDYDTLEEKIEAANQIVPNHIPEQSLNQMTRAEIEESVLAYAQSKVDEIGADVTVLAAKVYGSRGKGYQKEDSDLDVAISYTGSMREDDLFGLLHEDGFRIGDMLVDINPISEEKTGSLEEYLSRANQFLEEQHAEPKQTISYYVAECMEYTNLGEYHENLSFTEAVQIYEMIPAARMNAIKGIGFTIHTEGTEAIEDSTFELLSGKIMDVDTINHIQEFRDNKLVQEAIKAVREHFPEAIIIDKETRAKEVEDEAQQIANDCEKLAKDIDDFSQSYDPYGYGDAVDNKEDSITEINTCIMNGETEHITKWLQDVIDEEEPEEDVISAKELLSRLDDISVRRDKNPLTKVEELEEGNYDHIDGRLNNLNSKTEEKNEKLSIMEKIHVNKERTEKQNKAEKAVKEDTKKKANILA